MKKYLKTISTLALFFVACATPRTELAPSTPERETVVVFGFNDFHGALEQNAAWLGGHIRALRSEFGSRLLVLHAGDEWQGTLESNTTEGASVVQAFEKMGVQAAAVGNHEFDFGIATMLSRFKEAKYPYLTSNIRDASTQKAPNWANVFPSKIFTLGRVQVGVLGLSTEATPVTTTKKNVEGLVFEDLVKHAKLEAARLRASGAHVVVALAHAGLVCDRRGTNPTKQPRLEIRTQDTLQTECRSQDEIVRMIERLPEGTLDAVVAGHTHQIVHHWIKGVPVIQAGAHGKFFNLLYLTYDFKRQSVATNLTRVEGPVSVLEHKDFHDTTVIPDRSLDTILEPLREKVRDLKHQKVAETSVPITHVRTEESEMGNLMADALRQEAQTDLALVNPGGIRSGFDAGEIEFGEVYQAFPFDNRVSVLRVKGSELRTILRVAMSGARGYFGISGFTVKLIGIEYPAPSSDLNGDRKIDHWEFNRILEVRDAKGTKIQDQKIYTLATSDFLVNGGDDLGWAMDRVPEARIQIDTGFLVREHFANYLRKLGRIGGPLVQSSKPRIIIAKKKGR